MGIITTGIVFTFRRCYGIIVSDARYGSGDTPHTFAVSARTSPALYYAERNKLRKGENYAEGRKDCYHAGVCDA